MHDRGFSVVMLEPLEREMREHLMREDGQEDLAFGLYRPIRGASRDSAMLSALLRPLDGERRPHGNASFSPAYVERVVNVAREMKSGLFFIHSHPLGQAWQGLSEDDDIAERRLALTALAATREPLVGLTLAGRTSTYSARLWVRSAIRTYERVDAESVRVVGRRFTISLPERNERPNPAFDRTELAWGKEGREKLTRLRVGVVGLGSVGSVVAEIAARIGIERLIFVDRDRGGIENLDRTLNATADAIGRAKVFVAADGVQAHSPVQAEVIAIDKHCDANVGYRALLDCDFIFCCVDRPWGRRILNQLAYANGIPTCNGGILARTRSARFVGADWHVHTVGPGRRCFQCWKAFDPTDAALDRDGRLDDPSYLLELDPDLPLISHANAIPFAMNVATQQFMQFAAMVLGPIHNLGDSNFHAATQTSDITPDAGCEAGCVYAALAGDVSSVPPLRAE